MTRTLGPAPAVKLTVAALPAEEQRALGSMREGLALYDRVIERALRRSAAMQAARLARVGIRAPRPHRLEQVRPDRPGRVLRRVFAGSVVHRRAIRPSEAGVG